MRIYKNVQGTMQHVPEVEINVDTVYVRKNIERIDDEEMGFSYWQYDEAQYTIPEYIEKISLEAEEAEAKVQELQGDLAAGIMELTEIMGAMMMSGAGLE